MTNGLPYFYVVSAYNTGGNGPASDEAMAQPFVSPAAPSVTPGYGYSSDGMRAWKTVSGSTTYFLYDGSQPVCELDGTGAVMATNTWGGSLLSRRVATASTFYTFDPSGNLAQRLDASANVLGTYAFDAFGLRTGTDSTTDPYAGFGGGWGYYADAETGLSLLGHRYYDTGTGRFVTRDPIGYAGGADLYAYTQNNPVMAADPTGSGGGNTSPLLTPYNYQPQGHRLHDRRARFQQQRAAGDQGGPALGDVVQYASPALVSGIIVGVPDLDRYLDRYHETVHHALNKDGWTITDDQLTHLDFDGNRYKSHLLAYLEIRDGKVWILTDNTEDGIAPELVAEGIAKAQIVLGFYSPALREAGDFAIR